MSARLAARLCVVLFTLSIECKVNCIEHEILNDFIFKELKQLRNDVAVLKQGNKKNEERIARLETENVYLRNENDQLKKDIRDINKRINSMNTTRDDMEVSELNHDENNPGLALNATHPHPPSTIRIRKYSQIKIVCVNGYNEIVSNHTQFTKLFQTLHRTYLS